MSRFSDTRTNGNRKLVQGRCRSVVVDGQFERSVRGRRGAQGENLRGRGGYDCRCRHGLYYVQVVPAD